MVRMAARYGHFTLDELRSTVEAISREKTAEIEQGFSVNPLG